MRARHPRTAMGISEDRRTFFLVVVDGRSTTSAGMYGTELAELMSELGAWQAFNLDGGGSSEMWIKGRGTVNVPSDGTSRAVANHWGVFHGGAAAAHCMKLAPDGGADAGPDAGALGPGGGSTNDPDVGAPPSEQAASPAEDLHDDAGGDGCAAAPGPAGARTASLSAVLASCAWILARWRRRSSHRPRDR
jgi:hypothetical protein